MVIFFFLQSYIQQKSLFFFFPLLQLALTNPRIRVIDKLVRSGFIGEIGSEWVFLAVNESVRACRYALEESKQWENNGGDRMYTNT